MNAAAVITDRALYIGHTEKTTVPAFDVRCCNCGLIVWSSQKEGAGRSVTMDEIVFRLETHPCPENSSAPSASSAVKGTSK